MLYEVITVPSAASPIHHGQAKIDHLHPVAVSCLKHSFFSGSFCLPIRGSRRGWKIFIGAFLARIAHGLHARQENKMPDS